MNKTDIIKNLKVKNPKNIFSRADAVRKKYCGDGVYLRGIIEFSNYCKRNCLYCGLRSGNKKLKRYRMTYNEIFETAKKAKNYNYKTIVLQSGEDDFYKVKDVSKLVKKIKKTLNLAVTLSIGEKTFEDYRLLKDAGADRYLLKFETSNEKLFSKLKPDSLYKERIRCLKDLKKLGFQTGSGCMVGLPGQTDKILADDILLMKKLNLDMIGIGPFIPHPNTPLGKSRKGSLEKTLKVLALARIVTKNAHMPATTATGTVDLMGRQKALKCGANVIMPNLTPKKYRKLYEIYPEKICIFEKPDDCVGCVANIAKSVGRFINDGYGHSLKKT